MNIRDLQYLVAIETHKNFSKAAEECFVSQPALSMQIKKLEEYLGLQVIERNKKIVRLTDAGEAIVARAKAILLQVEEIKEISQVAKDPLSGDLALGIFPTLGPYLFPYIIPKLAETFPNVSFYLLEDKTESLIANLKSGKTDVALVSLPLPLPDNLFATEPLFEEEYLLAVPHHHPLAANSEITKNDLTDETLFLLEDGHCMRDDVLDICENIPSAETKGFYATSIEMLRHMVAADAGITIMPKLSTEGCKLVTFVPFASPKPTRMIGLAWRHSSTKKLLIKQIADLIKIIMQQKI
jgi:LysR family hydrogen peroxide-inducible transcriptional activator